MKRKLNSRSFHRYLSLFVGLQLFLWALSGLIFCWLPYDQVLAKHHVRPAAWTDLRDAQLMDVRELLQPQSSDQIQAERITNVSLRMLVDRPVYELTLANGAGQISYVLYDARSGEKLSPLPQSIAEQVAQLDFNPPTSIKSAELVEQIDSAHSEYRDKELPVWRVELNHLSGTTIYVSADRGIITARRNVQWRVFDFFWMLHTMDYGGRDNFNTWWLWLASIFCLTSVLSGFWLGWRSSRLRSWWRHRRGQK